MIAENLYDFLETCGHRCDFAPSLAAADALLGRDQFDALVLDCRLPDPDGALLASRLRAAGNSLAILMLTARDTLDDKLAGFGAGADDYLAKPFALKEVEARLQPLLLGAFMGLTRQAHGGHFISHILWPAWLAWAISASLSAALSFRRPSAAPWPEYASPDNRGIYQA